MDQKKMLYNQWISNFSERKEIPVIYPGKSANRIKNDAILQKYTSFFHLSFKHISKINFSMCYFTLLKKWQKKLQKYKGKQKEQITLLMNIFILQGTRAPDTLYNTEQVSA